MLILMLDIYVRSTYFFLKSCVMIYNFIFWQMVAKGKDASDLFPAVVKNVVSKNLEVGKTLQKLFFLLQKQIHKKKSNIV